MGPLVCCVDDSEGSRHALRVARVLAERLGLELVVLHVAPHASAPGVSAAIAGQERLLREEHREAEELLERLAAEAGLDEAVRHRAEVGSPATGIVEVCKDEDAALIVIGSRGRGGVRSALLGSVSSEVASHAPCPVVVVPHAGAELSLP